MSQGDPGWCKSMAQGQVPSVLVWHRRTYAVVVGLGWELLIPFSSWGG